MDALVLQKNQERSSKLLLKSGSLTDMITTAWSILTIGGRTRLFCVGEALSLAEFASLADALKGQGL